MSSAVVSAIRSAVAGVLVLAAPVVAAEAVNISWSRCFGEGLGTQLRSFACDTNAGTEVLVCSFVLGTSIAEVSGNEIVIDVLSQDDPLPAWWEFRDPGTCRQNSLGFNLVANSNDVVCMDWAQAQSSGGIGAYSTELGTIDPSLASRHRRLKIAIAVPLAGIVDLVPDVEYFACNVTVNHAKTVGTGACAGCSGQVCMYFASLKVTTRTAVGDHTIAGSNAPNNFVHWQGTGLSCLQVPVRNATWGQVKALYR